jgi:hypothetical protein
VRSKRPTAMLPARVHEPALGSKTSAVASGGSEEDDRRSLGVRKLSQRGEEVRVAVSVQMLDGSVWSGIFHAARLQRPG